MKTLFPSPVTHKTPRFAVLHVANPPRRYAPVSDATFVRRSRAHWATRVPFIIEELWLLWLGLQSSNLQNDLEALAVLSFKR